MKHKLVFLILIFFVLVSSLPGLEYFTSNNIGMQLNRISRLRVNDFEYYLEMHTAENKEIKRLFTGGRLVKEWELFYSDKGRLEKEIVRENNNETERIYEEGSVISEEFRENKEILLVRKYNYSEKTMLSRIEDYNPEGELISRKEYERDHRGNIRSITSYNYSGGEKKLSQISKYRFTGSSILEEWHGSDDYTGVFIFYNNDGTLHKIINRKENQTISEKDYIYGDKRLIRTIEISYSPDEKIIMHYSSDGMVYEEEYYLNKNLEKRVFNYFNQNALIRKIVLSSVNTERYLYFYDAELEKVLREEYYLNGVLMKETVYTDKDSYYEDFFLRGRRYMRIYYRDNEKYSTERW